jgi:hypothetical protein
MKNGNGNGNKTAVERTENGKFAPGNPGGPGRGKKKDVREIPAKEVLRDVFYDIRKMMTDSKDEKIAVSCARVLNQLGPLVQEKEGAGEISPRFAAMMRKHVAEMEILEHPTLLQMLASLKEKHQVSEEKIMKCLGRCCSGCKGLKDALKEVQSR